MEKVCSISIGSESSSVLPLDGNLARAMALSTSQHLEKPSTEIPAGKSMKRSVNLWPRSTSSTSPTTPSGWIHGVKPANKQQRGYGTRFLRRAYAEHAIELIELARNAHPSLREADALNAMELGARRIDFIGMKFQLSDEMGEAYAKALALPQDQQHANEIRGLLSSISSMNGRCQDLRDGYSMLKNLYQESWLAENRHYWLDNVLVRYDLRIQLWQKRGEDVSSLVRNWRHTHTLPTAQEAGLPPAPGNGSPASTNE